jgi:6-phosphogluconate dehydrogenase
LLNRTTDDCLSAALLDDIRCAFHGKPELENLLFDPNLFKELMGLLESLRKAVGAAGELGIPATGLMVSLAHLDGYRSSWSSAKLIQDQRDHFGARTYERIEARDLFHTRLERR